MSKQRKFVLAGIALAVIALLAILGIRNFLESAFEPGPTEGPYFADNACPTFVSEYPICEVAFGNSGLSTLNSFSETFLGEGAFEIYSFTVENPEARRYVIAAQSNRGDIVSRITADRIVRLGQDREDEVVNRAHVSSFCDGGRIYEHQVVYVKNGRNVQDLEFWVEDERMRFRLFQNGSPTADITCSPS